MRYTSHMEVFCQAKFNDASDGTEMMEGIKRMWLIHQNLCSTGEFKGKSPCYTSISDLNSFRWICYGITLCVYIYFMSLYVYLSFISIMWKNEQHSWMYLVQKSVYICPFCKVRTLDFFLPQNVASGNLPLHLITKKFSVLLSN